MIESDFVARTTRVLNAHALSLAEHCVMCLAGYRVTLPPEAFVSYAFAASQGDPRVGPSHAELHAALARLEEREMMTCLTDADRREETLRRATSPVPEVVDIGYEVGHVDFTPRGHAVHRDVIRAIHGDEFLERGDAGVNVDAVAYRFDVYAVSLERCRGLMETIQANGDSYTGMERTRVVGSDGPTAIAQWRPNRFIVRDAGFHGIVRFRSDADRPRGVMDGTMPRG